jgi:hypothetical protein
MQLTLDENLNVVHDDSVASQSQAPLKKKPFKVQKSVMLPAGITLDQVESSQQKSGQKKLDGLTNKSGSRSVVVDEETLALQSVDVALDGTDQELRERQESRSYTPLDDLTVSKKTKKKKKDKPKEGDQLGMDIPKQKKKKSKKRSVLELDPTAVLEPRDSSAA